MNEKEYQEVIKKLNSEQKAAVAYLEGPELVLAGPGTGKTQLLSAKVAYILHETDTNPENILCVTFTEAGAANMRERLAKMIGVKDAGRVNIYTYHAFGSDILSQYKNYAEDYNRNLDSSIDEVTQYKIIKNIQANLDGNDILRGDRIDDITSTIKSAKDACLTPEDLALIAKTNMADSEVLSKACTTYLEKITKGKLHPTLEDVYEPIYEILKNHTNDAPIVKGIKRSIGGLAKDLEAALEEAKTTNKVTPLSNWKDDYFEKNERNEYRLRDRVANKKLLSLANVMARYDEYLRNNNLFDYSDMIIEAIKYLKEDDGFRFTLSERFQYILLDEFQDTNPSQFEIIKQLTDYEKPLVMAVGDDDQAIFEFQGADSSNLRNFTDYYQAKVFSLKENYRSTQEILDFSHEIIKQADGRFEDKSFHAQTNVNKTQISRHEFLTADAEYHWVANQITELIKSGVSQKEIAIIAPKHKYLLPIIPFLQSQPLIKIAYERRENILEDERIHELITIARFVYDIANGKNPSYSLPEILSYPFWNISMLSVINLFGEKRYDHRPALEILAESTDEKLKNVAEFLANLVARSFDQPLEIFLSYIMGTSELNGYRSNFLVYYSTDETTYPTFEFFENLSVLRAKIHERTKNTAAKLKDFIELVEDYENANKPITSTSPYREAADAVQVLSGHKAKGLEFEHVFLIAADNSAWGKAKGNNNLLALPKNVIQIRHTGNTDSERIRLLFVAITRAKKTLTITNSKRDFGGKEPKYLTYLAEVQAKDNTVTSPYLPAKTVTLHYKDEAEAIYASDLQTSWLNVYKVPTPDMRAIYLERVKNYSVSATALTSFIDVVYAGPQAFFRRQVLRVPNEPNTYASALGTLVHAVFQKVTNEKISDEEAIQFFIDEAPKQEIAPEDLKRIREAGPAQLAIALKEFGKILRSPNSKAEVNLTRDHITVEGIPINGIIDHIQIDEENKTIEIYDFKTGEYHKEDWHKHKTLYKYMLQLGFYKLLLNNSPIYAKYTVTTGHILFVTPDSKDGEVHDKVYQFNAKDEADEIKILKSAYAHMKTLDILDDPDLMPDPNNSYGIKEMFEFIELMLAKTPKIN